MTTSTTPEAAASPEVELFLGDDWFDPLEASVRTRIRSFIEGLLEAELDAALSRRRYQRRGRREGNAADAVETAAAVDGHRHGHRERTLMGTFGEVAVRVPRARLNGGTAEWRNATMPA